MESHILHTTPSIGIALFPAHGADADALMQAADAAMYGVKRAGRGHCVLAEADSGKAGWRSGMAAVAGAPVFS